LYKISRDGCNAATFHTNCNNKGATVTVLYNSNGSVYGGYTSISWRSAGAYGTDNKAFLFRLYQNGTFKPVQFPAAGGTNAIYDVASNGPMFGAHDLNAFSGTVAHDGTCFPLNGGTSFGTSYTMKGENANTICNGNLKVTDLEVYLVEGMLNSIKQNLLKCTNCIKNSRNKCSFAVISIEFYKLKCSRENKI
jgi:hypothetical protein